MSRHFSAFTREDEKELFEDGLDENFLDYFRGSYTGSCSAESCSVDVIIDLNHATVDEIESWEPYEALIGVQASYDRYTTTLKLPDNILKLQSALSDLGETSALDSENHGKTFLLSLADRISDFQLQKIFPENPNKYKCATCQKTPVNFVSMVRRAVNTTTWRLHLSPCLPVCDSAKCYLIASKCAEKMLSTLASVSGKEVIPPSCTETMCANCHQCNFGGESKRLDCSRCKTACYCSAECQKSHWPIHKKACKLVTCQRCENWKRRSCFPSVPGANTSFIAGVTARSPTGQTIRRRVKRRKYTSL
jgi:hypothetical protein